MSKDGQTGGKLDAPNWMLKWGLKGNWWISWVGLRGIPEDISQCVSEAEKSWLVVPSMGQATKNTGSYIAHSGNKLDLLLDLAWLIYPNLSNMTSSVCISDIYQTSL